MTMKIRHLYENARLNPRKEELFYTIYFRVHHGGTSTELLVFNLIRNTSANSTNLTDTDRFGELPISSECFNLNNVASKPRFRKILINIYSCIHVLRHLLPWGLNTDTFDWQSVGRRFSFSNNFNIKCYWFKFRFSSLFNVIFVTHDTK